MVREMRLECEISWKRLGDESVVVEHISRPELCRLVCVVLWIW